MQRDPRIHEHRFNSLPNRSDASPSAFSFTTSGDSVILFLIAPNAHRRSPHGIQIIDETLRAIIEHCSRPTLDTDEEIFTGLIKRINTSLDTVAPLSTLNEQASSVLCLITQQRAHISSHGPDIHIAYIAQTTEGGVSTKRITPTYGAYKKDPRVYFEDYTTVPLHDKTAVIAATKKLFEYLILPTVSKSVFTLPPAIMYEHIAKAHTDISEDLASSGMIVIRPASWYRDAHASPGRKEEPLKNKERPQGPRPTDGLRLARHIKLRNLFRFVYGRWSVWYGVCSKLLRRARTTPPQPLSITRAKKQPRLNPLILRTLIILSLSVCIIWLLLAGIQKAYQDNQQHKSATQRAIAITQVSDLLARSEGTLIYGDTRQTQISLDQAQGLLDALPTDVQQEPEIASLRVRMQSLRAQALGQTLVDRKVFANLADVFPQNNPAQGIFSLSSGLYAYNTTSIARIDGQNITITATTAQSVTIQNIEQTANATTLACTLSDGNIALVGGQGTLLFLKNAGSASPARHVATFANALYGIPQGGTSITKSVQTLGAYAPPTNWSLDPLPESGTTITGMTIDGSIYVSTPTSITEFLRGKQSSRTFAWDTQAKSSLADIITGVRTPSLYAVDPQAGIIYEFSKTTGRTTAQYKIDIREYKGIAVSNTGSELYILDGTTIISIPLLRR